MLEVVALLGLNSWEDWSYLATILAAIINTAFLGVLIFQVIQGRKALEEARRSTQIADAAVAEAWKARIDDQAPRVIATINKPDVHGVVSGNSFSLNSSAEYIMPMMKDDKLLLIAFGELINEGVGTARVRLNGNGACFLDEEENDPFFVGEIVSSDEERILRPGESVRFVWSDGHSLEDWVDAYNNSYPPNPRGACFLEVVVSDYLEDGIIDNLYLEMSGRPLRPIDGDTGGWQYSGEDQVNTVSYPGRRTYRREYGTKARPLPWDAPYRQWREENTGGK